MVKTVCLSGGLLPRPEWLNIDKVKKHIKSIKFWPIDQFTFKPLEIALRNKVSL